MRFRKGQQSSYVEDRRGIRPSGGMAIGAGGGVVGLVIALLIAFTGRGGGGGALQDQLTDLLGGGRSGGPVVTGETGGAADDAGEDFMRALMNDLNATWDELFADAGRQYEPTTLVLFTGAVATGCGQASSRVGPFYCPRDRQAYVDLDFFDELSSRFGAPGDFAQAYVIAHEVGHHVTNLQGGLGASRSQADAIRTELQADCYAGVWANQVFTAGDEDLSLSAGDIEEGLAAAAAVGDDRIQEQAGVDVNPETWTHGSSAQRQRWFTTGYESGDPADCDTSSERVG